MILKFCNWEILKLTTGLKPFIDPINFPISKSFYVG